MLRLEDVTSHEVGLTGSNASGCAHAVDGAVVEASAVRPHELVDHRADCRYDPVEPPVRASDPYDEGELGAQWQAVPHPRLGLTDRGGEGSRQRQTQEFCRRPADETAGLIEGTARLIAITTINYKG